MASQSAKDKARYVDRLDFAEDIVLISNENKQVQRVLPEVEEQCADVGLTLNDNKTKYLAFNSGGDTDIKRSKGFHLQLVNTFKYMD